MPAYPRVLDQARTVDPSVTYPSLLAKVTYDPASITTVQTSSTSYNDVDATNLTLTFTVPSNGSVRLTLDGWVEVNTANEYIGWAVRSAGVTVVGSDALILRGNAANDGGRGHHEVTIAGLIPDTRVTWTWAHKSQGGGVVKTIYGNVYGTAEMRVWSVVTPSMVGGLGRHFYTVGSAVTLRSSAGVYASFPGLTTTASGLLAMWREGSAHTTGGDLVKSTSTNGGTTWAAQSTVLHDATYDYMTGVLSRISTGRIFITTWVRAAGTGVNGPGAMRMLYSDDDGVTWSSPITMTTGYAGMDASECPVLELTDGTLLVAVFGAASGTSGISVKVMRSTDHGLTWTAGATIADGVTDNLHYNETGITLASDGSLLATIREENNTAVYVSKSTDAGATWTQPALVMAQYKGAPRPIRPAMLGGLQVSVQRAMLNAQSAQLVVTDGSTWSPVAQIQPSTVAGVMLYGECAQVSSSILGVIWAEEDSTTQGTIRFTPVTVT